MIAARSATWRGRPVGKRELLVAFAGGTALSLAVNWAVLRGFSNRVASDLVDPLLQVWELAWVGHALVHHLGSFFRGNIFWPDDSSLAFSDSLSGFAPIAVFGHGTTAAVVRYNVLFIGSYALAFAGASLLALELTIRPAFASIAGAAYAFAPWRLAHVSQLNILSSGGIALSLFLLVHGYRRGSAAAVLGGWLVAVWQLSLGFNLGLELIYLLAVLLVLAVPAWLRLGRPSIAPRLLVATVVGFAVFGVVAAVLAHPYFEVLAVHPEARRPRFDVASLSPVPTSFIAAPAGNAVWGGLTEGLRTSFRAPLEQSLFPGLAIVALAVLGLFRGRAPRRVRVSLAVAAAVFAVLSAGFHLAWGPVLAWAFPYRWLYEFLPGWSGLRTPGRIMTLTSLVLALLAALGADRLGRSLAPRRGPLLAAALVLAIVVEGYGSVPHPRVPAPPAETGRLPDPLVNLPTSAELDAVYGFWSIDGFPRIVNGHSSFTPRVLSSLRSKLVHFPDWRSVSALRALGVRTVVFHPNLRGGVPIDAAVSRPVAGLPLTRRRVGDAVVYRLAPGG